MKILEEFDQAVRERLTLRSFTVAVQLLWQEEEAQAGLGRPKEMIGKAVRPCEGWHVARHQGLPMVMLEEYFTTEYRQRFSCSGY